MSLDEEMIVCAVRYALGRRTYIVGDVIKYVTMKKDDLSAYCKNIIIRDIKEYIDTYKRLNLTEGFGIDEKGWLELVEVLKGENNG
jgi:hypothetical protein